MRYPPSSKVGHFNLQSTLRCVSGVDITEKSSHVVNVSFSARNELFKKLNCEQDAKLHDTYTVIKYPGITIFEEQGKSSSSLPKDGWRDDRLVYSR